MAKPFVQTTWRRKSVQDAACSLPGNLPDEEDEDCPELGSGTNFQSPFLRSGDASVFRDRAETCAIYYAFDQSQAGEQY